MSREIMWSLFAAGIMIGLSVTAAFVDGAALGRELAFHIGLGLILAVSGNFIPKRISPGCDGAIDQRNRRFAGWIMVLAGLGYSGSWIFAPREVADILSVGIVGIATVLLLGRMVQCVLRGQST